MALCVAAVPVETTPLSGALLVVQVGELAATPPPRLPVRLLVVLSLHQIRIFAIKAFSHYTDRFVTDGT